MLTRCPHCQTGFRVTPEQLKMRQGRVRCGECRIVFDALDTLADEASAAPPPVPEESPPPRMAADTVDIPPVTEPAGATKTATPDTPIAPDSPDLTDNCAQPEVEAPPKLAPEPASADLAAAISSPSTAPATTSEIEENRVTPPDDDRESRRWQDGDASADAGSPGTIDKDPTTAEDGEEEEEAETIVAPLASCRRWPWRLGLLILLALAAGQLLFIFRVELAVLAPELRPVLAAGCDLLGCTLPRPCKPELVSIEASDLAPLDGDRLLLTATLKNRAPFDQEYPHLELTLTDTRDAALLRKALAPADYLTAEQPPATTGFAARGELAVKLTLEVAGITAAGYRLYLFYP